MTISNAKLSKFKNIVSEFLDQELKIRSTMKSLYNSLIAEAADDKMALRQVRQAYFSIQKQRVAKLLEEKLEFHPFFGASIGTILADEELDEEDEEFN